MKRTGIVLILFLIITAALIGCGGGGGGGGSVEDPISISPENATLIVGDTQQYTATVTGLSDQRVTWSATGGKIYEDGLYEANQAGTFKVIAISKVDPSKKGETDVTVLDPKIAENFKDIEAWQGYVTYRFDVTWRTGQGSLVFNHKRIANIKREYRLEEESYYYYLWRRPSDSPIVISGSIYERSEDYNKPTKNYMETNWNGQFEFVPGPSQRDYLTIDETKGTYSIVLYGFGVSNSPIITELYEGGDLEESWKNYSFPAIEIKDQPLPSIGKVLSGSKTEKWSLEPIWYGTGAYEEKETEVTITWQFTPAVE